MARLKERPIKITDKKDFTPEVNEKVMRHYDEQLRTLDLRRISQQSSVSDSAALADVISALNTLITALNQSDLTEDD